MSTKLPSQAALDQFVRNAYAGQVFPHEQRHFFSQSQQYFPVRTIQPSATPSQMSTVDWPWHAFTFESAGRRYDMYDYISQNRIMGLLLLKDGDIWAQYYDSSLSDSSRWLSMSMAKSIASTLVGVAIARGDIESLDICLLEYLPELAGGAYEDVTIRQLLQMSSGAMWNEDQTEPASERRKVLELQFQQKPGAITEYMSRLEKRAPAGLQWNYSTGETHIVGSLLRAATGQWLSDYLSMHIWQPLGMEREATWWLESDDGLEVAGSGFSACLRDYGRFARFMLRPADYNMDNVLPKDWLFQASGPHSLESQQVPYGFMWWSLADANSFFLPGRCSARGIFGQRLYLSSQHNCAAVLWCLRSRPIGDEPIVDNDFFNAFCEVSHDDS